jgi:hypothetical protein
MSFFAMGGVRIARTARRLCRRRADAEDRESAPVTWQGCQCVRSVAAGEQQCIRFDCRIDGSGAGRDAHHRRDEGVDAMHSKLGGEVRGYLPPVV